MGSPLKTPPNSFTVTVEVAVKSHSKFLLVRQQMRHRRLKLLLLKYIQRMFVLKYHQNLVIQDVSAEPPDFAVACEEARIPPSSLIMRPNPKQLPGHLAGCCSIDSGGGAHYHKTAFLPHL